MIEYVIDLGSCQHGEMDADRLRAVLTGRGVDVATVERLTAGASNQTYRVETTDGKRLAVRWSPGAMDESEAITLADEARVLAAARAAGVAVPEVIDQFADHGDTSDETVAGGTSPAANSEINGLVLEWIDGETIGTRIVRSDKFAPARRELARQCGQQLARIHSVPVDGLGLNTATAEEVVNTTLARYRQWQTPQPMIDFTARWLLDHLPDSDEPRLVHGDFRCGNLMIDPDRGLVSVLDWELAHLGDPRRDLGWMLNRSWRFGQVELEVGGFGTREDFISAYEAELGQSVDRAALHFWEVFGSFWWAVTCIGMVEIYREGIDTSFERLVIGRRSSEAQADCVQLLIPGPVWTSAPEADAADSPSSAEILTGIAEWLGSTEVTDQLEDRDTYLARVARNALMISAREADLGPAARAAEHERLAAIAGYNDHLDDLRSELIAGIEDGSLIDDPAVHEHLRLTVADQLAIDQPGYRVFGE